MTYYLEDQNTKQAEARRAWAMEQAVRALPAANGPGDVVDLAKSIETYLKTEAD